MYDDVELFDRYRFRRDDIMDLVDLVGDDVSKGFADNNAPHSCRVTILCVWKFPVVCRRLIWYQQSNSELNRPQSGCSIRSTVATIRSLPRTTRDGSHESHVSCGSEFS